MQSNRALGAFVVLLALAALAVWQFGFSREPSAPTAGATAAASGAKPERASERQRGPEAAAAAARTDGISERAAVAAGKSGDGCTYALLGQVVGSEGRPVVGARVIGAPGLGFANAAGEPDFAADPSDVEDRDAATMAGGAGRQLAERAEVTTDEQGRFRLQPPFASSDLGLRVLARGHAILDRRVSRPVDSDVDLGILAVERGVVVAGRVLDGQGEPVAGARVSRVPEAEERMLGATELDVSAANGIEQFREGEGCVTDTAGRFELVHVAAGEFSLRARHADHPTARSARLDAGPGVELRDIVVTMQPGAEIRGRVLGMPEDSKQLRVVAVAPPKVDGGLGSISGFRGTDVSGLLAGAGMAAGQRSAEVERNGAFVLRGLGSGSHRIWIAHVRQGIAGSGICSEPLEVAAGTSDVELRYEAGVGVSLTVVDAESGAPVERLWVEDRLFGDAGFAEVAADARGATRARSYPGGKVTVANLRPKPQQTLNLSIEATGYGSIERTDIALPDSGTVDLGTIRLVPKPVVHVTVVDMDTGTAIADASVRIESPRRDASPFGRRRGRPGPVSPGPEAGKTDCEGRCTLNAFVSAVGVIEIDCSRYAPFVSEEISFPETGVSRFTARLHVGGEVAVTVHDPDGKTVRDAIVEHRSPIGDMARRKTSANGIARFPRLAPGVHAFRLGKGDGLMGLVLAHRPGGQQGGQTAAEIPWQTVDVVDRAEATLLLTKGPTASLRGVVRENGLPLLGARVAFVEGPGIDEGSGTEPMRSMIGSMAGGRSAKSGDGGAYTLAELPEGEHRLRVTHRNRAMPAIVAVRLQNGDNLQDIELEVTTVRGIVLDPQGKPVDGARVKARRWTKAAAVAGNFEQIVAGMLPDFDAEGNLAVKTDATGAFELRGVDGDVALQVRASAKGFEASAATVTVARGTTSTGVELRLGAAGRIQVSIPSADGMAMDWVNASFVDESAGVTPVQRMLQKGKCTLEGLRPGTWRVEYAPRGNSKPLVRTVEVLAGETAAVEF